MAIRVQFYKAARGDWLDKTIGYLSHGPYSHVELQLSNGISFSSSGRDGGCRFKRIDYDDKWDTLTLPDLWLDEHAMYRFACQQDGKGYDFTGVLGFVLPLRATKGRWYCSEVVTATLKVGGILEQTNEHTTSPSRLAQLLTNLLQEQHNGSN